MENETATMFTGVNVGYQGDSVAITDPEEAVSIVNSKLQEGGARSEDYAVNPGVVVYRTEWGCPEGGEVVAAVNHKGDTDTFIKDAAYLREELIQSTLAVATTEEVDGVKTVGYRVEIPKGELTVQALGKMIQDSNVEVLGTKYEDEKSNYIESAPIIAVL